MSDILENHILSNGRSAWIQRIKIPGVRKPMWSVVLTSPELTEAPEITDAPDKNAAYGVLADILKADVCEMLD